MQFICYVCRISFTSGTIKTWPTKMTTQPALSALSANSWLEMGSFLRKIGLNVPLNPLPIGSQAMQNTLIALANTKRSKIKWFPCWPTNGSSKNEGKTWQRKCFPRFHRRRKAKQENTVQFTFQPLNVRGKSTKRNQSGMKAHQSDVGRGGGGGNRGRGRNMKTIA